MKSYTVLLDQLDGAPRLLSIYMKYVNGLLLHVSLDGIKSKLSDLLR